MPTYRSRSVAGVVYEFAHDDSLLLHTFSQAVYSRDGTSVWLHSGSEAACMSTVVGIFQASFVEELQLGDGRLLLGEYAAYDEDLGITQARNTVAVWTHQGACLWTEVGNRGSDWAADLMTEVQPAVADQVAYVANPERRSLHAEREEILIGIQSPNLEESRIHPTRRILQFHDAAVFGRPGTPGRQARAGELFTRRLARLAQ